MDLKQSQLAKKYLDLFLRYKMFIVIVLLLSLPAGLAQYLRTPKVYETTSLLSYQKQRISPNAMSPDVAARISDIVSTLTQIVTSRTNLESIIVDLDLYSGARQKMPMEDVIEMMRKKVQIKPQNKGDVFTISYSGSDPGQVVKVTNALAAKFIEENLKYRQERASETSAYTSDELQMAKLGMDKKENSMRDYKLKYYNEMPDQRETNVVRLIALQEQYQVAQQSIQEMERTLVLIQDQLSSRKMLIERARRENLILEENRAGNGKGGVVSNVERLAQMKSTLDQLLVKYTKKHPEVKRTKKIIAKLEKEISLDAHGGDKENSSIANSGTGNSQIDEIAFDPVIIQLEAQRKNVEPNLKSIRREKGQLKKKIGQYEKWVASAPSREAEWSSLTREYGQLKRHYDYLVSQDLQAKSMLNLERKQKGSQFKIEDPARFPGKPIKPNFLTIIGSAVLIGLGVSCGLIFVLDFLDTSFRDEGGLETFLGIPLISTIHYIETRKEARRSKWFTALSVCFISSCGFVILALYYYAWSKGKIVL